MRKTIVFVDGENFRHKVEDVLKAEHIDKRTVNFSAIDLRSLLRKALNRTRIHQYRYYAAKIRYYPETTKKSQELILLQRRLKTHLEKQGFHYILAGTVRGQEVLVGNKKELVFHEKGVDVKIGVDLVALAADGTLDTAVLCSSDSDLQPAIAELGKRKVHVIYLGFQQQPNKGLTYTTNETILFRNSEVVSVCPKGKRQHK
jgi:uncharacterized LabA/DUF88 family protein